MPGGARRWALAPALALTAVLLLTACGEEGGGLPSGSGSRTASLLPSRTASLPSADGTAHPHRDALTDAGADRGTEREPPALAHALGVGGPDQDRRSALRVTLGGVALGRAHGDRHAVRLRADVRGPDGVRERVRDGQRERIAR